MVSTYANSDNIFFSSAGAEITALQQKYRYTIMYQFGLGIFIAVLSAQVLAEALRGGITMIKRLFAAHKKEPLPTDCYENMTGKRVV